MLVWTLLSAITGTGFADSAARLRLESRKLQTIRDQIQQIQSELIKQEQQRNALSLQLRDAEINLNKAGRKLHALNRDLAATEKKIRNLNTEQNVLHRRLSDNQSLLAAQLRSAYMTGHQERLKLLLNQQDPSALSRIARYYEYLNSARLNTIRSAEQTLSALGLVETQIRENAAALQILHSQHKTEYQKWLELRKDRQQLVTRINQQIEQSADAVNKLRADQTRVQELIASLSGIFSDIPAQLQPSKEFPELKGLLSWPLQGPFLNRFGQPRGTGSDLIWQGISIAAPAGAEVRAVSHGRIAFADWLPGLGLMIIIDHGLGYMSLYGHNQLLFKETGDWVQANEIIAGVGDSGGKSQTALYFEVRHQGEPLNPAEWCGKAAG